MKKLTDNELQEIFEMEIFPNIKKCDLDHKHCIDCLNFIEKKGKIPVYSMYRMYLDIRSYKKRIRNFIKTFDDLK